VQDTKTNHCFNALTRADALLKVIINIKRSMRKIGNLQTENAIVNLSLIYR